MWHLCGSPVSRCACSAASANDPGSCPGWAPQRKALGPLLAGDLGFPIG